MGDARPEGAARAAPGLAVSAVIVPSPRAARLERVILGAPGAEEAVVRVELCGICTPEQRVYGGRRRTYPYWGGHELCGVVERVPAGAGPGLRPGSRVAVALMRRCGACRECRAGRDNHCAYLHPEPAGDLPQGPRGFSDRVVVPPYKLFAVPDGVPAEAAALAEPVACVLHSIRRGAPCAGEAALVLGGGTMGLLHGLLLGLHGCRVLILEEEAAARAAAEAAGMAAVPAGLLDDPAALRGLSGGAGFDLVFCTRFGPRGIDAAIRAAARGGRVVLYQSVRGDDAAAVPANLLHYQEVSVVGTIAQTARDMADAVALIAADPGRLGCLRTATVPAARATDGFEHALRPEVNRVMLDFRG
jgi:L-iditol 2-dehydrogenase